MAELVYAADLKSAGLNNLVGSSPTSPTNSNVRMTRGTTCHFVLKDSPCSGHCNACCLSHNWLPKILSEFIVEHAHQTVGTEEIITKEGLTA